MKRKVLKLQKGKIKRGEEIIEKERERLEDQKRLNRATAQALELGLSIALPIVAGALFGRYLDHVFSTAPTLMLLFLFVGVIIGGYRIIKLTREDAV